MNPITTSRPPEEGLYLFFGTGDGRVTVSDLRGARPQIVRVLRNASGQLSYFGLDVVAESSVGAWVRIDEEVAALAEVGREVLLDAAAKKWFSPPNKDRFGEQSSGSGSRKWLVSEISAPIRGPESARQAERIFDRALAMGLLVETRPDWFVVAQPKKPPAVVHDDNTALRVPSVVPDRWVYLRAWTNFHTHQERTWANSVLVCVALPEAGRVSVEGLPRFLCDAGSIEANVAAIDAFLRSRGAESVAGLEWPENSTGANHRPDRVPYRSMIRADYNAWTEWVASHEPDRSP